MVRMVRKKLLSWRAAFTLVELLVVVAIIGILIALLLPAIQAAREAARRSDCSNKLRQFGLGIHNYTDRYKQFPVGVQWGAWPHENWQITLLPFMDNAALYDAINHNIWIDISDPSLGTNPNPWVWNQQHPTDGRYFRAIALPFMKCPSDSNEPIESDAWAITSYSGCAGNSNTACGHCSADCRVYEIYNDQIQRQNGAHNDSGRSSAHSGVFSRWSPGVRLADITDGQSNTFAVGEILWDCVDHRGLFWHPWHINTGMTSTTIPMNIFATCLHVSTKEAAPFEACKGRWEFYGLSFSFRSRHPQGCNFLMCDDSVKFLLEDIDEQTYRNLGCMQDGFVVDMSQF